MLLLLLIGIVNVIATRLHNILSEGSGRGGGRGLENQLISRIVAVAAVGQGAAHRAVVAGLL